MGGVFPAAAELRRPLANTAEHAMSVIATLPVLSRVTLYVLLALFGIFTSLLLWAQINTARGRPFQNPDGTKDDWTEHRLFWGIAWADILVACPTSYVALVLMFLAPRWGFFLMGMVAFFFVWANLIFTLTSLRFERPKITLEWLVVFPTGTIVGLLYLVWAFVHFQEFLGP
jgi:hypothetical protein